MLDRLLTPDLLRRYKARLTDLSRRNRSLYIARLSAYKDLDWHMLSFAGGEPAVDLLQKVIAGHSISLISKFSAIDENLVRIDRQLSRMYRELRLIEEETGQYDLAVGFPFVVGRFADGTVCRAPLLLFPVKLEGFYEAGGSRWKLRPRETAGGWFNTTFFRAYEKYNQVRITDEFWNTDWDERPEDVQELINTLYQKLQSYELSLDFNTELFQFEINPFRQYLAQTLKELPVGILQQQPEAVLGIFPQSDSPILLDYEVLESRTRVARKPDSTSESVLSAHVEFKAWRQAHPLAAEVNLPAADRPRVWPQAYSNTTQSNHNQHDIPSFLPIDGSQEAALSEIWAGKSLCIQGPPGTGKSQLIVNAVCAHLMAGKKVLVVSQKRAALDVVYKRLSAVGIGAFCALVHDSQMDRNRLFQQWAQLIQTLIGQHVDQIRYQKEKLAAQYNECNNAFLALDRWLDTRDRFMAMQQPCGLSLCQLYYLVAKGRKEAVSVSLAQITALKVPAQWLTYTSMLDFCKKWTELQAFEAVLTLSHDWYYHNWPNELTRSQLLQHLSGLADSVARWHELNSLLSIENKRVELAIEAITTVLTEQQQWAAEAKKFVNQWQCLKHLPNNIAGFLDKLAQLENQLDTLAQIHRKTGQLKHVLPDTEVSVIAQINVYVAVLSENSFWDWLFGKQKKARMALANLSSQNGTGSIDKMDTKEVAAVFSSELAQLKKWQALVADLRTQPFFSDLPGTFGDFPNYLTYKQTLLNFLKQYVKKQSDWKLPIIETQDQFGYWDGGCFDRRVGEWQALLQTKMEMQSIEKQWHTWLHVKQIQQLMYTADPAAQQELIRKWTASAAADFDKIRTADLLLKEFSDAELKLFELLQYQLGVKETAVFCQAIYINWLETAEAVYPVVIQTGTPTFENRLDEYQKLEAERRRLAIELLLLQLKAGVPEIPKLIKPRANATQPLARLQYRLQQQRQRWSLRKLVQEFWQYGLSQLAPCVLASPESVAAIFPMRERIFDIIIFDEASQCLVARALPVLLRAPQQVVVGDRKQLPPFDLFTVRPNEYIENSETSDEQADDSEDTDDTIEAEAESILELTEFIFPTYQLRGHYRSADPKLIDFSNQLFYRGTLEMIAPASPSPDWQPPIVFQRVEQGVWKKRANLPEAKAVLAVIEKLLALPQPPTIGVVTFNQGQQEAILNELYLKLCEDRAGHWQEALERYENGEFVGLFVKNIENVQGDERDVIIFSMGYGPDEKGKIRAQFGSLNQQGGENRLNVAISRARRRMYVISSIEPTALPIENTKYSGPKLLRSFLSYAQAISDNDAEKSKLAIEGAIRMISTQPDVEADMLGEAETDDYLTEQMRSYVFTESNITAANNNLGIAGFTAEQTPIAISCETPQWLTKGTARDRYIYRPRLLREKGWQPKIVWARRLLQINH